MGDYNKKITRRTIFTITSAVILFLVLVFTVLSFAIKNEEDTNKTETVDDNITSQPSESVNDFSDNESFFEYSDMDTESLADISDISEISEVSDISDLTDEEDDVFEHGWIINEFGYTYVYGDCGYEQFNYKTSALQRYVSSLNNFVKSVPQNTRVFSITVPVSSTFAPIPREIYTADNFYNQAQSTFVSTVSSQTDERVIHIPIVDLMESNYDNGHYVYYRTDKNWTADGAYLAYSAFCEKAGLSVQPIAAFPKHTMSDYLGSFYNATKSESMAENPDVFVYYSPSLNVKSTLTIYDKGSVFDNYSVTAGKINPLYPQFVFLGREAERYEIHTTVSGGSLLLIGDESIYPCIPFLMSHYSRIDVINPQRFQTSFPKFFANRSYDDCLLMCYSTNSISGDYVPTFNYLTGEVEDE